MLDIQAFRSDTAELTINRGRAPGVFGFGRPRRALFHAIGIVLLAVAGVLAQAPSYAEFRSVPLDSLEPSRDHERAVDNILQLMRQYHYHRVEVDDELSEQIFDRFLESLDPQKSVLLASDIEEFSAWRTGLDNALKAGRLDPVFDIFKRFRTRMEGRARYARDLLEQEFDFTIDETYTFNREDEPWLSSQEEADEFWRKRVKNDVLSLKLVGQSPDEITEALQQRYERMERRVSQLSVNEVFQTFVNAYTLSVEPHTSYFSPRTSENFRINMSLSLEGIGAALTTDDEFTVIQRIIPGGPASLSQQLSADDRIVGVGQGSDEAVTDVVSWPLSDVVDLIRGPKGSVVRLEILPAGEKVGSPTTLIELVRDKIKLEEQAAKSSVVDVLDGDQSRRFGVIDLPTFYHDGAARSQGQEDYRSTARDVARLLEELQGIEGGVDGVIVDLRGNGGGALQEAIALTGLFIETGPVVQIKNARGQLGVEVDDDPAVAYDGPLAVLVDRRSASASEIFAGAVQDYGRGIVLGEPTFGKGTVQSVAPLDRDNKLGQLKITFAQFFRVNGESTQHRGVVPELVFPTAMQSDAQGERGLDNALPWDEVRATDFVPVADSSLDVDELRRRHENRYSNDALFDVLIDELESQREARTQRSISLLEEEREQSLAELPDDRARRNALVRTAFGFSDGDDEGEAGAVPDILLNEAAHVLNDVIDLRS